MSGISVVVLLVVAVAIVNSWRVLEGARSLRHTHTIYTKRLAYQANPAVRYMSRPPLTPQTWPVMYADASAARKWTTRAISSGRHNLPCLLYTSPSPRDR